MKKAKRTKYEDLSILPNLVAETVCGIPYTSSEYRERSESQAACWMSDDEIAKIEAARKKMTQEEIREFADICDARCKFAYEVKAHWMENIVNGLEGDGLRGRDLLYCFLTHWMTSYLMTRVAFMRNSNWARDGQ
jgi:hypothetical protein